MLGMVEKLRPHQLRTSARQQDFHFASRGYKASPTHASRSIRKLFLGARAQPHIVSLAVQERSRCASPGSPPALCCVLRNGLLGGVLYVVTK